MTREIIVDNTITNANELERAALFDLYDMLSYKRPAYSKTEKRFIAEYIDNISGMNKDAAGNRYITVGDKPTIMWSSHTDTVHDKGGKQSVVLDQQTNLFRLSPNSKSNCLGADCTIGVWLMREMIFAQVPGLYIFHAAEEIGGVGSSHIAKKSAALVEGIKFAVAFDRKGKNEVITHQIGEKCASDDFAYSLAQLLPGQYKPSADGVFTDTANYSDIIPECVNIGVGYSKQHSANETQCAVHALQLFRSLTSITQEHIASLVVSREPGDTGDTGDDWQYYRGGNWGVSSKSSYTSTDYKPETVYDLVADYPGDIADLLEKQLGYSFNDLKWWLGLN